MLNGLIVKGFPFISRWQRVSPSADSSSLSSLFSICSSQNFFMLQHCLQNFKKKQFTNQFLGFVQLNPVLSIPVVLILKELVSTKCNYGHLQRKSSKIFQGVQQNCRMSKKLRIIFCKIHVKIWKYSFIEKVDL